jgi:hypothetical protein
VTPVFGCLAHFVQPRANVDQLFTSWLANSERFADDEQECTCSSGPHDRVRPRNGELNEPAAAGATDAFSYAYFAIVGVPRRGLGVESASKGGGVGDREGR